MSGFDVIRVETPDGVVHERRAPADVSPTLAEWLESGHLPLNTRCGGRGLCRGCLVVADGSEVRACQTGCGGVSAVRIPEASRRDNRLNGVSSFEIGSHRYTLRPRAGVGLALDIGTTTVAAALWDLQSGECLASGSAANEQRRYGDNVLSRIEHAVSLGGASPPLQSALVADSLEPMVELLCAEAGIGTARISEAVAAGNTVMLHSLAGASLAGFSAYPFTPEFIEAQTRDAEDLGFSGSFPVHLAANLGPFVGADIAVGALASGMCRQDGPALLIDYGTNGEILLKSRDGFLATATAAGPAFEGGRLTCGAPAGDGVVSSLRPGNGRWRLRLADHDREDAPRATGISGAAYVDFMAHARATGLLNAMGRFDPAHPDVIECETDDGEVEKRVRLAPRLHISEVDVAELIQAKAAIAAGVMTLLEEAGLELDALETVYIAGGFGYHLDWQHAMAIGMMPTVDPGRIRVIGNASLGGASLMLQTDSEPALRALRERCRVIELNELDAFEGHYIDCMPLAPIA